MLISDEHIETAEAEAQAAAVALAQVEAHLPSRGAVAEPLATELAVASARARQAAIRLAGLRAQQDQQRAALSARANR
jgi:hypothetical protein